MSEFIRIVSDVACGLATMQVGDTGRVVELVYVRPGKVESSEPLPEQARYLAELHFKSIFGGTDRGDPNKLPCTTQTERLEPLTRLAWFPGTWPIQEHQNDKTGP